MNRTNMNVTSFVAGMIFVVLGGMFLLDAADVWTVHPLVVGPVLLIGMGIATIAGTLNRHSA